MARCGFELSKTGPALTTRKRAESGDTEFVENLWRNTWECEPDHVGKSCMAARLNLCRRVYAEYGPDGILLPGLFKPIIHK